MEAAIDVSREGPHPPAPSPASGRGDVQMLGAVRDTCFGAEQSAQADFVLFQPRFQPPGLAGAC
jgi:hypothetical protein